MHIPDGYLSPQTCAVSYAAVVPAWMAASRRVTAVVKTRNVPLLAMFAAVSFLVMMFNVPIPDGTTAHAVGAVIIAIVLGPWAAVIAVSVALLFQALLFGDGGVLAYGANVLNMAIIMPFAGLWTYRLLAGRAPLTARRRTIAAAVGGYVGINAAALAAAVEFGLQPVLFHTASGAPLYAPYHLAQTIPAMALAHLTVAGAAEAILTAGVFGYLARADVRRLVPNHPGVAVSADGAPAAGPRWSPARVAVGFVAVMVLLAPLGLLAPGGAFGEDAPGDLKLGELGLRAIPEGLNRYNGFWSHTLLADYGFSGGQNATLAYWLSAVVGIAVVGLVLLAAGKLAVAVGGRARGRPAVSPAVGGTAVSGASGTGTPGWLLQPEPGMCPCGCIGKRKKGSFVEKTLDGGAGLLRQVMFGEDVAAAGGLLQRLDPRVKLVGLVVLLVALGLVQHIAVLVVAYTVLLGLAAASRLPVALFVRRVWLFVPLFTGVMVAPATLSIITPGHVVVQLWTWHGHPEGLTAQGLTSASLVVARVACSISLVVLLTLTTPWVRLLSALGSLGVPRIFVLVIGMAYRYVFLLLGTVTDMYTARKARTIGAQAHDGSARAFLAASAGAVFGKAHQLSEEVHQAMVARGYRGHVHTLQAFRFAAADAVAAATVVLLAIAVYGGDRILGR